MYRNKTLSKSTSLLLVIIIKVTVCAICSTAQSRIFFSCAIPSPNYLGQHHFEINYLHTDSFVLIFINGQLQKNSSATIERLARYVFLHDQYLRSWSKNIVVSFYNGVVNWQALKNAGINFAICRTGYGKNGFDETFQRNVNGEHAAGLKCGAYHYSYALNPADAIIEADFCKRICRAFLDIIKPLDCGIYASYSWLKDYIN